MATRNNAMSEIVKFWLEARQGCLVKESIPVKLIRNYSDIDLLAMRPDGRPWKLPKPYKNISVRRAIVETKDEHDFDKKGRDFGKRLEYDVFTVGFGGEPYTPADRGVHFSMLRKQHYDKASELFGPKVFHRIFIVHDIDDEVRKRCAQELHPKKIFFLTIREIIEDLRVWYNSYEGSKAQLRNTLTGDMWHLLFGYCLPKVLQK